MGPWAICESSFTAQPNFDTNSFSTGLLQQVETQIHSDTQIRYSADI